MTSNFSVIYDIELALNLIDKDIRVQLTENGLQIIALKVLANLKLL